MQVDTPHTQAHHSFLVTLCAVTVAGAAPRTPLGRLPPPRGPPRTVRPPREGPKVTNRRAIFDLAANFWEHPRMFVDYIVLVRTQWEGLMAKNIVALCS
jgi:hypothetical protein